jgi:hypothetical protein
MLKDLVINARILIRIVTEIKMDNTELINLAQDREQWRSLLNAVRSYKFCREGGDLVGLEAAF